MRESIGEKERHLKIALLIRSPLFVRTLFQLPPTQYRLVIGLFLERDRSIPLILRLWLSVLKMSWFPAGLSKMILLYILRALSWKWLSTKKRQTMK